MDEEHCGNAALDNSELLYSVKLFKRADGTLFLYARGKMAGGLECVYPVQRDEAEGFVEEFCPNWKFGAENPKKINPANYDQPEEK